MKVLITSGGTKIKIDMVRHIGNMSKGTFGAKICDEFIRDNLVDEVVFLMAEDSKYPNIESDYDLYTSKITIKKYVTFDDYREQLNLALSQNPDIVVLAAAVSDYGVENYVDGKIRSSNNMVINLIPLPKLISTVREKLPLATICGFKLLVNSTKEELYAACKNSLLKNDIDLVVGNDLRDIKANNHTLSICEKALIDEDFNSFGHYGEFAKADCNLAEVVKTRCLGIYAEKKSGIRK